MKLQLASVLALATTFVSPVSARERERLGPLLDGESWQIAGNPDLGPYTMDRQEPLDFAVWQAADGTWQLWSCIRATGCGGQTRLLHRWEGKNLTDKNWEPKGIAMEACVDLGEIRGGLQAPHVVRDGTGLYHMFYGTYENIATAQSRDGKEFSRIVQPTGQTAIFGDGPGNGTRDAMLIQSNGLWYCYYTAHVAERGSVMVRTSSDLKTWSYPSTVSGGGRFGWHATSHECPHVVEQQPGQFYLFATQIYGKGNRSAVFTSDNPMNFGLNDDSHYVTTLPVAAPEIVHYDAQWYVAHLMEDLKGIRITKLKWEKIKQPAVFEFDDAAERAKWTIESGNLDVTFTNADRQRHAPWTEYFIATDKLKNGGSDPSRKGVILSPPFKMDERDYVMLASGSWSTNVFIIDAETSEELAKFSGRNGDKLRELPINTVELGLHRKTVRIKLVDSGNDTVVFGGLYKDIKVR